MNRIALILCLSLAAGPANAVEITCENTMYYWGVAKIVGKYCPGQKDFSAMSLAAARCMSYDDTDSLELKMLEGSELALNGLKTFGIAAGCQFFDTGTLPARPPAMAAAAPARGRPLTTVKVDPPVCEITVVKGVTKAGPAGPEPLFENNINSRCAACSGQISYANGKAQVGGYEYVPAMEHSRVGDHVRLCLVSYLAGCPPGDDRGHVYSATNLRTRETWTKADSSHMCGGV